MNDERASEAYPYALPRRQVLILGALGLVAALALAILFMAGALFGPGEAKAAQPLSHFLSPRQQLASLEIEPVRLRAFPSDANGGAGRTALAVPARAVIYDGDGAQVWVAGNDGSLALREVTLGRADGDWLEVTRGLSSSDKILVSGALFTGRAARGE
jgi:hypothetical protein